MPRFEKPPKYVYSFEDNDGFPDMTQIFDKETHHLAENFMQSMARFYDNLNKHVAEVGDRHLRMCESCRNKVEEIEKEYKEPEQLEL